MQKSTYDPLAHAKAQEQAGLRQMVERNKALSVMEDKLTSAGRMTLAVTDVMDLISGVISSCGGGDYSGSTFVDVSRDTIIVETGVPIYAPLFMFLPETDPRNDRFHKKVTQMLLLINMVHGVRWIEKDRGSKIVVSLKRD